LRLVASASDLSSTRIAELARYWDAKRGQRSMPTWAEIDPAEIKPLLPQLMVARYERAPFRVRYSLVGTWIAQYAGADFTGRYLDELDFLSELDTDWAELHRVLFTEGRPIFVVSRYISESGLERDYETAMLPIADAAGIGVERSLCMEDFPQGAAFRPDVHGIAVAPKPVAAPDARQPDGLRAAPQLEPIDADDGAFRRCLEEAGLPTVDLAGAGKIYFRLEEGGESRAYGGFEVQAPHALLRSIVVGGRDRGHGYGRTLVLGLVAEAQKRGLRDVYLLTEKATPFFAALGFVPCAREDAPAGIAQTRQFAELCPVSAKLMRRDLR
jgi:N-acetylglutamate synthase-like GNAT family acetyltransferase